MRRLVWTLVGLLLSVPVAAQEVVPNFPAPVRFQLDGNGVNLTTGGQTITSTELTIGPLGAGGLAFAREYVRGTIRTNWDYVFYQEGSNTYYAGLGLSSRRFTLSGSTFTSTEGDGATLVKTGTTTAPIYTLLLPDGTTVVYNYNVQAAGGGAKISRATAITSPTGEITNLHWVNSLFCIIPNLEPCPSNRKEKTVRLQSIVNSQGYMLRLGYQIEEIDGTFDVEGWYTLASVKGINLTLDYCSPTSQTDCTVTQAAPVTAYSKIITPGVSTVYTVTDAPGRTWRYTDDRAAPYAIRVRRPSSATDTMVTSYDANGKVASVVVDGLSWSYAYTTSGSTATMVVTDPVGKITTVVSSLTVGLPTLITDPLNRVTSHSFDATNRLTETLLADGQKQQYAYDARGNVTTTTAISKTPGTPANIVTSAAYAATCTNTKTCNKPISTTDAKGNVTSYSYDAAHGGILSVTGPAVGGVQPQVRTGYSSLYAWYKNSAGTLVQAPAPIVKVTSVSSCQTTASCSGTADEVKQTIAYQVGSASVGSNLLPVTATAAAGNGSVSATSSATYDPQGNVLTVDGPLSGAADTTRMRYNAARQVVGVVGPDPDGAGPLKHRAQRFTYNADSQLTVSEAGTVDSQSDAHWAAFASTQQLTSTYDANGRKVKEVLSAGGATFQVAQMGYDARGRPDCTALRMNPAAWSSLPASACTLGTAGAAGPDRIGKRLYDDAGQVTKVQTAVGTSAAADEQTLTYTPNGRLATLTDGELNKTTYEYDGHDRLLKTRFPLPTKGANASSTTDYEQLSYDANSNVTQRRLRDAQVVGYGYDVLNRMTLTDRPSAEPDLTYQYDLLGRVKTVTQAAHVSQGQHVVTMTHDALGRIIAVNDYLGTTSYQYDAAGRRTRLTWPDAFYVTYDTLVTGEVTAIRENGAVSGAGVLATFAYNNQGMRTQLVRGNGTYTNYDYDVLSRLYTLNQDPSGTAHDLTLGFSYNPASQLATTTRSNDAYAWTAHYNVNRPYTANGLNQYSLSGGITPTYDARGNLTAAGGPAHIYTSDNLLSGVNGVGSLAYDPLRRLIGVEARPGSAMTART